MYIFFIVISAIWSVCRANPSDDPNVGIYIIPRNNPDIENPVVMTLTDSGNWYFAPPDKTEMQIFVIRKNSGRKLCLKYKKGKCLQLEKKIDKDLSLYKRTLCIRAVKENRISIVPSAYSNFFMIKLKKCDIFCLFSHKERASRGDEVFPSVERCKHSNINNHFYIIGEDHFDDYYAQAQHENREISKTPANTSPYADTGMLKKPTVPDYAAHHAIINALHAEPAYRSLGPGKNEHVLNNLVNRLQAASLMSRAPGYYPSLSTSAADRRNGYIYSM
ncbi:hypothetical protein NEPAR06_1781 [Nematocida parisii]|uniref:Uncharacterized protein n=1 Tax=Nematocida parisii (strain ERTm3) TaxID=935791 RepID=I3EKA0_NEMP3|nr:uncharacterized protein NEPG_00818 [Nematocida parisii ERTm1]EIJ89647.1 hypothetical protein NEQG_00417 [Nematocida parisii ERTm3]KAI5126821.1 hypothetical protein NEPAR03_0652 [Nematocida parisii]EIJ94151.1 hypothetical protein NEPG_00818 [Nematocida parisii ERTm1]KAI5126901.1 hypothetical protein NEPAR08_0651 [Nematocida parisii]KAI5141011.1 hypothetical protein NEPAR04_0649 [Nematocida parisii]|eukprot:XP_013058647.1 hypothetical protein NEPG_00818 [Nematocida parisii ERTm1]